MLNEVYNRKILELAGNIPHLGRLPAPDASATAHSKLCGSTVTVDLSMEDGRVARFAQEVKACALGQAAAAVLGEAVIGRTAAELQTAAQQLEAMLKSNGPVPDAPFAGFEALLPARDFKNRHASILLAVQAAAQAARQTEA